MRNCYFLLVMLFSFPLQAQIKESSLYIKPIIAYEEGFAQFVKSPAPPPNLYRENYLFFPLICFGIELGFRKDSLHQFGMGFYSGTGRSNFGLEYLKYGYSQTIAYDSPILHFTFSGESRMLKSSRRIMETSPYQFSLLYGFSICHRHPKFELESKESSSYFSLHTVTSEEKWGLSVNAGLCFRLLSEKKQQEILGIALVFRQGLSNVYRTDFYIQDYVSGNNFHAYSLSRGTSLALHLTYPFTFAKLK